MRKNLIWICAVMAVLMTSLAARAATISYGNGPVIAPGVQFVNIQESSSTDAVPLFGAPASYFPVGIDFNPVSFGASGTAGAGDFTDGQLNFGANGTFTPSVKVAISQLSVAESGDFTLFGTGTNATQVAAGASIHVTVTEIDGVALTLPIVLTPVNASVAFNLLGSPGILQPWSLGATLNIAAQLTSMAVPYTYGATKIDVVIDDNLLALSEANSGAFIAKKDFKVSTVNNVVIVPEPVQMSVLVLGAAGFLVRRRREQV
jgi:hypothetical protein